MTTLFLINGNNVVDVQLMILVPSAIPQTETWSWRMAPWSTKPETYFGGSRSWAPSPGFGSGCLLWRLVHNHCSLFGCCLPRPYIANFPQFVRSLTSNIGSFSIVPKFNHQCSCNQVAGAVQELLEQFTEAEAGAGGVFNCPILLYTWMMNGAARGYNLREQRDCVGKKLKPAVDFLKELVFPILWSNLLIIKQVIIEIYHLSAMFSSTMALKSSCYIACQCTPCPLKA